MDKPDTVDVGVGEVQCGPYHCDNCGASEIGPEYSDFKEAGKLDPDEIRTGFYKSRISPHANQYEGKIISHRQADALYRENYFKDHGNPYNAPVHRL